MKKIICLILILVICFSNFYVAAAATVSARDNSDVLKIMEFLQSLGIVPSDYRELELDNEVTRADYADTIAKLIKAEGYDGDTPYFYDVPSSHWAYDSICSLAKKGIIVGTGDKLFHPDETIRVNDAYKIILIAMGYDMYERYNTGHTGGYLSLASKTKLNSGVSSNQNLTYRDMYMILYNSANIGILDIFSFSGDGAYEYAESDKTLFSLNYGVYRGEGVLTGANGVNIEGKNITGNTAEIDGVIYDNEIEIFDYLGEKIEFFYRKEGGTDDKAIIWAKNSGLSDALNITVDNDAEFDSGNFTLKYCGSKDGSKSKTIRIARDTVMIYNGGIISEKLDKYFRLPRYSAKLFKNGGSEYNLVIISAYENIVTGSIDMYNRIVYDKGNIKNSVDFHESRYDYFKLVNESGAKMAFEDISSGDVLTVYKSADDSSIVIKVSERNVSGKINSVQSDGVGADIVLDNVKYYYPDYSDEDKGLLGSTVTAYINVIGEIAYIEFNDNDMRAAWLIDAKPEKHGIKSRLFLKILDSDSAVKIVECKEKLKIDDEPISNPEDQYSRFIEGGVVKQQLILIKDDAEKLITEVDTAYVNISAGEGVNTLQVNVPRTQALWRKMTHGGYMAMNKNTTFFVIPENLNEATDDDYTVIPYNKVPNERYRTWATSYKTKEKVGVEQYVVLEFNFRNDTPAGIPILVEKVRAASNEEGDLVYQITGYQGSSPVKLLTDSGVDCSDIVPGTVIRISQNYDGEVTKIVKVFNPQSIENGEKGQSGFNNQYDYVYGPAREVVDTVIKIDSVGDDAWDRAADLDKKNVIIYHGGSKPSVGYGSISDIIEGDYVCLVTQYADSLFIIVYK